VLGTADGSEIAGVIGLWWASQLPLAAIQNSMFESSADREDNLLICVEAINAYVAER